MKYLFLHTKCFTLLSIRQGAVSILSQHRGMEVWSAAELVHAFDHEMGSNNDELLSSWMEREGTGGIGGRIYMSWVEELNELHVCLAVTAKSMPCAIP